MTKHILTILALTASLGMSAQTNTNLVIEETNGNKTSLPTSKITGVMFEDAPSYTAANHLLSSTYASSGDNGVYTIELGTDAPDALGDPSTIGGMQVVLQFIGTASSDKYAAELPEGYYRLGATATPYTISINGSAVRTREEEGEDGTTFRVFINGTVDVRHTSQGEYDIRVEMTTLDSEPVNVRYQGPVHFNVASSEYEAFTEDQNITFEGGQERFYGNWNLPLADDAMMQFYTGSFVNDVQVSGYWLNIETYMPKYDDPMHVSTALPDGTYRIDTRETITGRTYNPFTFVKGETVEFFGQYLQIGSYLTQISSDGKRYLALIRDGEFTVSNGGKKVDFNLVDENGNKITGTYNGNILVGNFCDNEDKELKPPYSTLTGDHTLTFAPATVALVYKEPQTFVIGYDTYDIYVMDSSDTPTKDVLMFSILVEEGKQPGNGTYTIGKEFGPNVILPGRLDYTGNLLFSWYGDNDSADAEGYQSIVAPLAGGTLTISDGANANTKTFTFDFTDDANLKGGAANKITGSWTGTYYMYDENAYQAPAVKLAPKK